MSNQAYSAIAIANAFIDRANMEDEGISPMKIQKLIYFAHAWMLALSGRALISDPVKAWKFGPVIDSVYHEFKNFGNRSITNHGTLYHGSSYSVPEVDETDHDTIALVEKIWAVYGKFGATQLSDMTHEIDSPWYATIDDHKEGQVTNYILSNEVIGQCMSKQLKLQ
jgi:uncharacterized phage-associated protein